MAAPHGLHLFELLESLGGVLSDRFQHPEALPRVADQALLDKRLNGVEACVDDLLGRLEGEWQVVEAPADLHHRLVTTEVRLDRPRPRGEEIDALRASERRHAVL